MVWDAQILDRSETCLLPSIEQIYPVSTPEDSTMIGSTVTSESSPEIEFWFELPVMTVARAADAVTSTTREYYRKADQ
jgi:hypothetical protein